MDESRGSDPSLILASAVVVFCSLFLVSCGGIEFTEQVPQVVPSDLAENTDSLPAEHDLAILAIDFNPPLDYPNLWAQVGEVTLLIAVENRGLAQEQNVKVSASLSAPRQDEVLLRQSTTLRSLAPGEVEVVRFGGISSVPYRSAYRLGVEVAPVTGESILSDNAKTYELTIDSLPPATPSSLVAPLEGP